MIHVKNIGRGPQSVDGCGMLAAGDKGRAQDTEHTRALINAGHLLDLTEDQPAAADVAEEPTKTTARSRAPKGE